MFMSRLVSSAALCVAILTLQGCDESKLKEENEELKARVRVLEKDHSEDCQQKCSNSALYGRWSSGTYGHQCMESTEFGPQPVCRCSPSRTRPKDCRSGTEVLLETEADVGSEGNSNATSDMGAEVEVSIALAGNVTAAASREAAVSFHDASAKARGSPRHTVHNFCDKEGLKAMHSSDFVQQEESEGMDGANQLEANILNDISKELETNNVDKMAKEIFTFYVCVRWIPEGTFWEIAKQELAANLVQSIVDHNENLDQAVAELYQRYKYVPLLCSRNLEVWRATEEKHHTYFGQFREDVKGMARWLEQQEDGKVHTDLVRIDTTFCGGEQMNSKTCNARLDFKDTLNDWLPGVSFEGKDAKWKAMQALFSSFESRKEKDEEWRKDMDSWKAMFPYHSFIDKPGGMSSELSPTASQRFLVCFGKRVASELHRRANGQHIMTDQNNIGCHGWWDQKAAQDMLNRMVELWKPPTCQLAEMVYTMKKEILSMFVQMNERLFDALPTMLMDEELDKQDMLDQHMEGPGPYQPSSSHDGEFVDGMRVTALTDQWGPNGCDSKAGFLDEHGCRLHAPAGKMGTVEIVDGKLHVLWGRDKTPYPAYPGELHIMPHGWQGHKSMTSRMRDLVAGVSAVADKANQMFSSMFRKDYAGLSVMMSESVSKWIVCPVRPDADMEELDSHLGVEDAAFQDFRKEAYSKWTGYEAKVPGEECHTPDFLQGFAEAQVCDISELHSDHVEKYFTEDGDQEAFICPLKPDLRFDEQLTVLAEKKDTCFLRMTNEQARHYGWQYRGDFPARRQNDEMENPPRPEFELVKLLKVPEGVVGTEVSFGRYCPLDELLANPRFCDMPQTFNLWPSVDDLAKHLAGTVAGAFGVGAAALQGTIATFQKNVNNSEKAVAAATMIKETTLDGLFGTGRLLARSGQFALAYLNDGLPGAKRRKAKLQEDTFGSLEGGALLHRLSFQRSLGADGKTSNAKARWQRYVVSYPCGGFDPAMQFSIKREWGQVARRLVREAAEQQKKVQVKDAHVLDYPKFEVLLRGEGRVFQKAGAEYAWGDERQDTGNTTFFQLGASVQLAHLVKMPDVNCTGGLVTPCEPADRCYKTWTQSCLPKTLADPESWMNVKDELLAKRVGALSVIGGKLSDLKGFKLSLYCGEKRKFGKVQGEGPEGGEKLLDCLKRGVKENAQMRAREPWKLYFENEVVVVAAFDPIEGRWCKPTGDASPDMRKLVCSQDAVVEDALDSHLTDSQKRPTIVDQSAQYKGMHSGAGYPTGSPKEVVLKPEDILEAVGLLVPEGIVPQERLAQEKSSSEPEDEERPQAEEEMA